MNLQPTPIPTENRAACSAVRFVLFLLFLLTTPSLASTSQLEVSIAGSCPAAAPNTFYVGSQMTLSAHVDASSPDSLTTYPPCQVLTGSANGVTGKPPITLTWNTDTGLVLSGNPVQLNTAQLPAGSHTLTLTATNPYGHATLSTSFTVEALAFASPPTVTYLSDYQVAFLANTTGATEWQWDWGDGTSTPWTGGCAGRATAKTYAGSGPFTVTLRARNCRDAAIETRTSVSPALLLPPKVLQFAARNCPAGFCIVPPGVPILFDQSFEGTPTTYRYDWNGDGTFEETSANPVPVHSFAPGFYQPVLQVQRGTLAATYQHLLPIEIELDPTIASPPPPTGFTATRIGVAEPSASGPTFPPPAQPVVAYRFSWAEPANNETGFNLYVSKDGKPFQVLTSEPRGTTSTETLFFTKGSIYSVRVTAFNLAGEGAPSSTLSVDLR